MLNDQKEKEKKQILIFVLGETRYAIYLAETKRVVQAVEITPLPNTPQFIPGVINMQGQIIPVVDIRPCFGKISREVNPDNLFILANTSRRMVALMADTVTGILEVSDDELVNAEQILPGAAFLHGLAKVEGDLVLLCDLDQVLSQEDERTLEAALATEVPHKGGQKDRKTRENQNAA